MTLPIRSGILFLPGITRPVSVADPEMSLEQFIQELADSGLMSDADIQVLREIPRGMVESSGELADSLVERGHLTAFQAKAVLQGDGQTLVLGNYTVLDRIGAGGMGVVLKALHRRMEARGRAQDSAEINDGF